MRNLESQTLSRWNSSRNAEAFAAIIECYSRLVYSTAFRILRNASDAEDVTQECFQALAQTSDKHQLRALGPWLHRVATNLSINLIRSESRRRKRETHYTKNKPVETQIQWDDIFDMVDEAIAELPEKNRAPIVAHFLMGESHSQIARASRLPRRTVTNRINKGLEQIGVSLRRRGVTVCAASLSSLLTFNLAGATEITMSLKVALGKTALSQTAKPTAAYISSAAAMKAACLIAVFAVSGSMMGSIWTSEEAAFDVNETNTLEREILAIPPALESTASTEILAASTPAAITLAVEEIVDPLPEPFAIHGRVYDVDTGLGIAGARISARPESGQRTSSRSNATLEDGIYEIRDLDPGDYELYLGKATEPNGITFGLAWFEEQIVTYEGEPLLADFEMDTGLHLRGFVVDQNGEPVEGARVRSTGIEQVTRTDDSRADGSFQLFALRHFQGDTSRVTE